MNINNGSSKYTDNTLSEKASDYVDVQMYKGLALGAVMPPKENQPCLGLQFLSNESAFKLIKSIRSSPQLCNAAHKEWESGLLSVFCTVTHSCLRLDQSGREKKTQMS